MYIDIVPNRNSPPAILLRESVRIGKKITKRTIANLSSLSLDQAQLIRQVLKGEPLVSPEACFDIVHSKAHGDVGAVLLAMRKLGFDNLVASHASKNRSLVVAMIASRILNPESKLAFRSIKTTDLEVRPIYHYDENRVRTHLFICMLAYYVKWHMGDMAPPAFCR